MIFSRKKRVTPKQMAADIWGAFVQIMQHEFEESNKHDRDAFINEHGWDYDKKRFTEESSYLFTFLIYNEVENRFPDRKIEILKEFTKILEENDMGFLLNALKDYSIAWYDALAREFEIHDDSVLNNPLYCISKLASIRCFGENDGLDPAKITMFLARTNPFVAFLADNFKRYKVV